MLNAVTVEFEGRKAIANSYSDHPILVDGMNKQVEQFRAMYPRATVSVERMTYAECVAMVAEGNSHKPANYGGCHYSHAHAIGEASKGKVM